MAGIALAQFSGKLTAARCRKTSSPVASAARSTDPPCTIRSRSNGPD